MAWRRSVYCRNCGIKGHNRRGCPSLTTAQKEVYANGEKSRVCSWCSQTGHNKTTCNERRKDRAAYVEKNAEFRRVVLASMHAKGLGIGALVTACAPRDRSPHDRPLTNHELYIVNDINWSDVQCKVPSLRVLGTVRVTDGYQYTLSMPSQEDHGGWDQAYVISGVKNPDNIVPPEDWLKGESGTNKYFG